MIAGKIEGKGSYGIVYSLPRLPFKKKYSFLGNIISNNDETVEKLLNNNEVSKIFYLTQNNTNNNSGYLDELNNYKNILKLNIPNIFFNKPLNYGEINHNMIKSNPNVYNSKWSEGNLYYESVKYQITFDLGKQIKNDDLPTFYKKFGNLINCIDYLNKKNIIFDDLKIDNILEVNGVYKLSDFSSIKKIDHIDTENFNKLLFFSSYYFIYLPYLNKLLKYYIYKKINPIIHFNKIFKELKNDVNSENSNSYIKFNKKMITNIVKFIQKYEKCLININLSYKFKKNIKENNKENNKLNILTIDIKTVLEKLNNTKFDEKKNKIFCNFMINEYYKNKDDHRIIKDLMTRMNIYSLGIVILHKIYIDINNKTIKNMNVCIRLLKISILCCLNYIDINNYIYIFEPNIKDILKYYNLIYKHN